MCIYVDLLFTVSIVLLGGFSPNTLDFMFHLAFSSLHLHKPLVQGFRAKVLSPLIWMLMDATLTISTHPHSKTAATHTCSGTASRTPAHTGTLIKHTGMGCSTVQL